MFWLSELFEVCEVMKIAITLAAGRPRVIPVLRSFLNNAKQYGYDLSNFSVYISADTDFQNTSIEEFDLPIDILNQINHGEIISKQDRINIGNRVQSSLGISESLARVMFYERGYSPLRNCALLRAVEDDNDVAIFFDDDEIPIVPMKSDDGLISWHNLDYFTPHIHAIQEGAQITRGPYLGYISPIPSDFDKNIPSEIRRALGEALSHGSEIITADSFMNLMNNQIRFLKSEELVSSPSYFEVKSDTYGKKLLTGNMAVDLNAVRAGQIPLFYTPPQARGEDAIFAMQLSDVKVVEVNSFIFHDPFNMYPELLVGKAPLELHPIPVSPESIERFASALIGWLKYAPILVRLSSNNYDEERFRIERMLLDIKRPAQKLSEVLENPKVNTSHYTLKQYYESLDDNFQTFQEVQDTWKNGILKTLN